MARATVSYGTGISRPPHPPVRIATSGSLVSLTALSENDLTDYKTTPPSSEPLVFDDSALLRARREKPLSHEQRDREGHDEREEQYWGHQYSPPKYSMFSNYKNILIF